MQRAQTVNSPRRREACDTHSPEQAGFSFFREVEDAVHGAGAVLVLTEWDCYAELDWMKLSGLTNSAAMIFDGRKVVDRPRPTQLA
jgi:UDP-glucose 6-dehydrogenase